MVAYCSSTWLLEIVERGLRGGDAGLGLRDLGLVVGGIDLDQEIAGLDALEIVDGDGEHLAGDPAAQPRQLGANIGVVGGLDRGAADPGIPAQRRQRDEAERDQHGEQRNREAAPRAALKRGRAGCGDGGCGLRGAGGGLSRRCRAGLILLTQGVPLKSASRDAGCVRRDMTTIMPQTVFSGQRQRSLIRHTSQRGLRARQV